MKKNTNAVWHISLDCECPHCNKRVDLTDHPDFYEYRRIEASLEIQNQTVCCPQCGEEFVADFEY